MAMQPGAGLAPTMGVGASQNFPPQNMMGNNQIPSTNQMMPASQDNNNYHFRFKIALVGDSGVGKTTFLDAISQTLGSVVENEESSELHIKVGYCSFAFLFIDFVYCVCNLFLYRQLSTLTMHISTRSYTSTCRAKSATTSMFTNM